MVAKGILLIEDFIDVLSAGQNFISTHVITEIYSNLNE